MKPTIYPPVTPLYFNQRFGENNLCVKDFGLPTQHIVWNTGTCQAGYSKLYAQWGMLGHNGTDLMAGEQPVYASMDGVVVEQQTVPARGLGLGILSNEQYDFGDLGTHYLKLRYWHLKSFNVQAGSSVKRGDLLGITDNTGYSSGSHLHFEGQLMDKDSGGHPFVINTDNGYFGAVNIEPYIVTQFLFTKNLWLGMWNNDVLELQKRLKVDYSSAPGLFGPRTLAAVRLYQATKGISTTGFVGILTRTALNSAY